MKRQVIDLCNSVFWDRHRGDKVYMEKVQVTITGLPFALRQIAIRFIDGPNLDFSTYDMDRIALAYLKMRGVKLPATARALLEAPEPIQCDFVVPGNSLPRNLKKRRKTTRSNTNNRRRN